MPDHRPVAVVDLASSPTAVVMTTRVDGSPTAQLPHEAAEAGVASGKAVVIDRVLPDRHRVAPAVQRSAIRSR